MSASSESESQVAGSARGGAGAGHARTVGGFSELMQKRVRRILLISSLYDSFILSEEGNLQETLQSQFLEMNASTLPRLVQVSTGKEAFDLLSRDHGFDLIICGVRGDTTAEFVAKLREGCTAPIMGLAYTSRELNEFSKANDISCFERVFLYQGDVRLIMAMILGLEDRLNVANDIEVSGVPLIILVEDNIRFYSSFLPTIYGELFRHTHKLLSEDLNSSQKMLRMRARSKVLLCNHYEEAWGYFERYQKHVLGIISDFQFPRDGVSDPQAGLNLCQRARGLRPDLRLVLQSSDEKNGEQARRLGASFLTKGSPLLLHDLQELLTERFGFGDFIFRLPNGVEVGRAHGLKSLAEKLKSVPSASVGYHGELNHFSNWLKARTEFVLAERLEPHQVGTFDDIEELRQVLVQKIEEYRLERHRTVIADFDRTRFQPEVTITRIGGGSIGGKARGVAFANRILRDMEHEELFPGVDLLVPPSVVLGTQTYDEFLKFERIHDFALSSKDDEAVAMHFQRAPFPHDPSLALRAFLQRVQYPLAVRSSSLLEDSVSQPFAGVYDTLMLPNNSYELEARVFQLESAVKHVYASAFTQQAKSYLAMTSYRLEEEKMGVMIQQLVGQQHGDTFYPDFAGVARSHNFYPEPGHRAEDGVAVVALGLGRTVVGGGTALRFCPKHPRQLVRFSSVADALENSQREFIALDLTWETGRGLGAGMRSYPLEMAEEDGPLAWLGSTFLPDDDRIVDGISRSGVRLVSFAQVLKHEIYPLARILSALLDRCSEGTGGPVEIEFAGNLGVSGPGKTARKSQFAFLQLRPLALSAETEEVAIGDVAAEEVLCRSNKVLGNGLIEGVHDIVAIDLSSFDRMRTQDVAQQVAKFDALLRKGGRPYLLIGVGRWGSSDPRLGIPVSWNQISGARIIVESGFEDLRVAPSQGTHFFQNLTSSGVGYFTVNPTLGEGKLDWDWLAGQAPLERTEFVVHLRTEKPLVIKLSGRTGEGIVLKP
ncbi:MAG: histidine kinase [Planctomycetes bacterium]|jgi:hypothetical protein|nr:histidine kinase [Planctomycetota bacterium]